MNQSLIVRLVCGENPTIQDIESELHDICDRVHSGCNSDCPVYSLNGDKVPNRNKTGYGCDCFKNGGAMRQFILGHVN